MLSQRLRQLSRVAFSLRDTLRNVTGLSLNAGEGGIQGDNLTLRGFSARMAPKPLRTSHKALLRDPLGDWI
jgi:outer membrane receptor for monomeric catechols